jgi:hypothetical protein
MRGLRLTEEQYGGILKRAGKVAGGAGKPQTPVDTSTGDRVAQGRRPRHPGSKYRNVRVVVDGLKFDSKREAARWQELKLLERSGEIRDLERQQRYRLFVNGTHICDYVADFTYWVRRGDYVVEDSKGVKTEGYRLKKKLMQALHGIEITET